MRNLLRQPYTPPQAEFLPFSFEQPVLNGSSTLENGVEDDGWGNDVY